MSKLGPKPKGRIDLGLAICAATRRGMLELDEIAAYADCSGELIRQIEARALRKLRTRCHDVGLEQFYKDGLWLTARNR